MASIKREASGVSDEHEPLPHSKRPKLVVVEAESSDPQPKLQRVILNPADCSLDFNTDENGLQGSSLHEDGFSYCWSGARANVGITGGKYCFSCKIISAQPVNMEDTPLDQQHLCRLGVSRGDDAVGNLGETDHSYGYGGTGKFSNAGKFSDYGEKYGIGDTIVCCVDLENRLMAFIEFSKNGKRLGSAKHFDVGQSGLEVIDYPVRKLQWQSALFPHVLLKNVVVQMHFSIEDGLVPEEGYKPWAAALDDGNAVMGPTFPDLPNCEVMMLVGLPASGKTTWAEKWVKEHPEKRYILLGTNLALDQMKVPGLLRKNNYGERFDRLMDRGTGIFNTLLSRASRTPRNFIIDQTNVYKSARKRKLKPFADYKKIAVVVFPPREEVKLRADKRFKEMGKEIPAEAVNEMLANYVLPMSKDMPMADEYFDEVIFTELDREDAQRHLNEMKSNLKLKRDVLPYACDSSIKSYSSRAVPNSCGTPLQPHHSPALQNQDLLPVMAKIHPTRPQIPFASQYVNYSSAGSSLPSSGLISYGSYGRHGQPWPSDPYQTYTMGNSYSHLNVENRNCLPGDPCPTNLYQSRMVEPYPRTARLSYDAYHLYTSVPGYPSAGLEAHAQPTFLPRPTSYGFPGGAPPSRPAYGNFSAEVQHPGAHVPSRPGHY